MLLDLKNLCAQYLVFCNDQKNLSDKTIRAYRSDLDQFLTYMETCNYEVNKATLTTYITELHRTFKPKTAKRKIACLKAFFNYLEYDEFIDENPFSKIRVKFKEPVLLPKTIPAHYIERMLKNVYREYNDESHSPRQHRLLLRDICVLELLFATGMRVSELCSLRPSDIDLTNKTILIWGKGSKERILQVGNRDVLKIMRTYNREFKHEIANTGYFFVNRLGNRLSEQSVRTMISKYVDQCGIPMHVTPHMFRHSFASLLLEENVDIRYIQHILGHSSITTTQIYTHVTSAKQRHILTTKHPRNKMNI